MGERGGVEVRRMEVWKYTLVSIYGRIWVYKRIQHLHVRTVWIGEYESM